MIIVLAGAISIPSLADRAVPELAAPQVSVVSIYIGASAEVVESAVTTPLERQINGVEGMKLHDLDQQQRRHQHHHRRPSTSGANVDLAAVDVQNRVNTAAAAPARRGEEHRRHRHQDDAGHRAGDRLLFRGRSRSATCSSATTLDLYVRDAIQRIPGAADVRIFGERKYAMRLWLDPVRLAARGLTAERRGERAARAERAGSPPARSASRRRRRARRFRSACARRGGSPTRTQFERPGPEARRRRDARPPARRGPRRAGRRGLLARPPLRRAQRRRARRLPASRTPTRSTCESAIRAELERLSASFPPGLKYEIAFDPTTAVRESIRRGAGDAAGGDRAGDPGDLPLPADWRATLIPAITIPVSLIGTFAFVKLFGFSINTLTLFGITLATGLVVDDAIVVIENI